jgi:DNA primase
VAPLGTALTEDQLRLLWRAAPEPVLAFDGDAAGLKAAQRAALLALPHLKAGYSLRFAFLPAGEDPDTLIAKKGAAAMARLLDEALPLSEMLWRAQTEDRDLSTPERRAGLEQALRGIIGQIADGRIADYYRRDFDARVFERFRARKASGQAARFKGPGRVLGRPAYALGSGEPPVSAALKQSLLARASRAGSATMAARNQKEMELGRLLLFCPALALDHAELLASLPFQDPSLDRLRHELLNLAASGSSLEKSPVLTHFAHQGMAELLTRLGAAPDNLQEPEALPQPETEARFLRAAGDLREIAERGPERTQALERFAVEGSEDAWREARRFLRPSGE